MLKILGWVVLGILLLFLVLLLLPVHTRVRFAGSLQVWAGLGPVSLQIFPLKKKPAKKKAHKKQNTPKSKKKKAKEETGTKPKKQLTLEIICDFIRLAVEALGTLRRRLVIQKLTCHLKIANGDAAATALLYGRVAAAVSALYPIMERNLRIWKTDISVDADFEAEKTDCMLDITLAVCPLRLIIAGIILLIQFLKINRKMKKYNQPKEEKGGINHEQHS